MIDIVLVSTETQRAAQIAASLTATGIAHRLQMLAGGAAALAAHAAVLKSADLAIVDDAALTAGSLGHVEALLGIAPQLDCMLVVAHPSTDMLMAAMRAGVRHVLPWPLIADDLNGALSHVTARKRGGARRDGRVIAFGSCKGGSGVTTLAVNTAWTLAAQRNKRVLLLDLNQQFADASLFVSDARPHATLADVCAQIERLDATLFDASVLKVSDTLDVLAGAGDPVKATELRPAHLQKILAHAREHYDAVIVDVGQSIDPLALTVLDQADTICTVLRQSLPYLQGARRQVGIFRELGYPASRLCVIVNQYDKQAAIDVATIESTLDVKVAHTLPRDDKQATEAANQGTPLVASAKSNALAQAVGDLTERLWPSPAAAPKKRSFGRWFAARDTKPAAEVAAVLGATPAPASN